MANRLRYGILCTGNIAAQFANGVEKSARSTVAAVGSRVPATARRFADRFQIPAVTDYAGLVNDPNVDAIYISGPNSIHREWTIRALAAGKHVLCEKPIALNAAEAEEMFAVAQQRGLVLMEAFMYLCHPQTAAVVKAIQSGAIGELKLIQPNFCFSTNRIDGNIRFDLALGGGALMDVGCYCTSFCRLICNAEPEAIHAVARMHSSGVDELTTATMKFPGGVLATFACGMLTNADNTARVSGTTGRIEVDWPWKPGVEKSGYRITANEPPRQNSASPGASLTAAHLTITPGETRVPAAGELYGIEADAFSAAVLDRSAAPVSAMFTIGNMRTLDRIRAQIGLQFGGESSAKN